MPDEYGMNLAPNTASSMAVQLHEMKRMAAPYTSNCINDWSMTNLTVPMETNYSLSVSCSQFKEHVTEDNIFSCASASVTNLPWLPTVPATGLSSSSHHSLTQASSSPSTSARVISRGKTTLTENASLKLSNSLTSETGLNILIIIPCDL